MQTEELSQAMEAMAMDSSDYPTLPAQEGASLEALYPPIERTWSLGLHEGRTTFCEEARREYEDSEDEDEEEPEDALTQLLQGLNQCPSGLFQLLTKLQKHGEDLETLTQRVASLEKTVTVQQGIILSHEKTIGQLKARQQNFLDCTVRRTMKLELGMAQMVRCLENQPAEKDSQEAQDMEDLKKQILSVYTPEVLCNLVRRQELELATREQRTHFLVHTAHRLQQINRTYHKNFYLEPKPLEPEVVASLCNLTPDEQQQRIQAAWAEISHVYNNDEGRCTLFEMETHMENGDTFEDKMDCLRAFFINGQMLQKSLKKSSGISTLAKTLGFKKATRPSPS